MTAVSKVIGEKTIDVKCGFAFAISVLVVSQILNCWWNIYSDSFSLPFFLQIISYDSPRGGVSVITEKGDTTTSFLLIQNARPSDSGQYTCNPSNAKSKSVTVHVLNGKYIE